MASKRRAKSSIKKLHQTATGEFTCTAIMLQRYSAVTTAFLLVRRQTHTHVKFLTHARRAQVNCLILICTALHCTRCIQFREIHASNTAIVLLSVCLSHSRSVKVLVRHFQPHCTAPLFQTFNDYTLQYCKYCSKNMCDRPPSEIPGPYWPPKWRC